MLEAAKNREQVAPKVVEAVEAEDRKVPAGLTKQKNNQHEAVEIDDTRSSRVVDNFITLRDTHYLE